MEESLERFLSNTPFTRGEFVVTALAAGFALAVRPVFGEVLTTDAAGLTAGEVKIPVADGEMPAYRAMPGKGDLNRLGITGFCWGGRIVWLYAAHSQRLKAGVAWYGRLVGEATDLQPQHPIDIATKLKAPVLGLYGGADTGIPIEMVERMRQALQAAGSRSEIVVYPDAPHGFHADYRPSYRKEPAQDGWKRLQAWFKKHGVA